MYEQVGIGPRGLALRQIGTTQGVGFQGRERVTSVQTKAVKRFAFPFSKGLGLTASQRSGLTAEGISKAVSDWFASQNAPLNKQ